MPKPWQSLTRERWPRRFPVQCMIPDQQYQSATRQRSPLDNESFTPVQNPAQKFLFFIFLRFHIQPYSSFHINLYICKKYFMADQQPQQPNQLNIEITE